MNTIYLIEGCDCSGKTTLAQQLKEKFPNHVYIHNSVVPNMKDAHQNVIQTALQAQKTHTVIIDRLHLSERFYGNEFRHGTAYDTEALDQLLNECSNLKRIICHLSWEDIKEIHSKRYATGQEMYSTISNIWKAYENFNSPNWVKYNWKTQKLEDIL